MIALTLKPQDYVLTHESMIFVEYQDETTEWVKSMDEVNEEHTFTVQEPPPVEERTTFHLKPLSSGDWYEFEDGQARKWEEHERNKFLLEKGLVGWSNMRTEGGGLIGWTENNLQANLDLIPAVYRNELAGRIYLISALGEDEVKN